MWTAGLLLRRERDKLPFELPADRARRVRSIVDVYVERGRVLDDLLYQRPAGRGATTGNRRERHNYGAGRTCGGPVDVCGGGGCDIFPGELPANGTLAGVEGE